ncbi:MAG: hypothetical protein CR992_00135 [Desulfobacterales bacterium]|nr:MAG: hypothetical protein CR992_00135 [Desulfobacterales bacterium]
MIHFLKKHKEKIVLIGLGFAIVSFVGGGLYLQKRKSQNSEARVVKNPDRVEISQPENFDLNSSGQGKGGRDGERLQRPAAFYLKPSPEELLGQLQEMQNLKEDVAQKKLIRLPVIWPLYFFEISVDNGEKRVVFDVLENGFGVEVVGKADFQEYPELLELENGQKVWIGGTISGVELSGTGVVHIDIQHVDLTGDSILGASGAIGQRGEQGSKNTTK